MAFDTFEEGLETSRPTELYTITIGSTVYRYTSGEDVITVAANTFDPVEGIERSALTLGGPSDNIGSISITLPAANAVAQQYIQSIPGQLASVEIDRYQRGDGSTARIFEGRIRAVTFSEGGYKAVMDVLPTFEGISQEIPRFRFSSLCNHVLYDDRCQVDDTSSSFRLSSAACTAVSGRTITVTGADANGDGFYTGGFVENAAGDDRRLILDQTGEVLTLMLPFSVSPLSTNVTVFAGCDHTVETCRDKFDNVVNFGGFPYVPTKNPFRTGLTT